MKKQLLHYSFLIPLILFLGHQLTQRVLEIPIPFADNYLDPFCMSALALHAISVERNWLFGSRIDLMDMIIATLFLSVVSELLFPWLAPRFVADWYDVPAIFLGSLWFMLTAKYKG
ncbi:MAG: hypothetical protein WBA74_13135 [Cyclobacteriaceae bacterium]